MFCVGYISAQDIIALRDGTQIQDVKVNEVTDREISYTQNGNSISISRNSVEAILYEDGNFVSISTTIVGDAKSIEAVEQLGYDANELYTLTQNGENRKMLLWQDKSYSKECRKIGKKTYYKVFNQVYEEAWHEAKDNGMNNFEAIQPATEKAFAQAMKESNEALRECSGSMYGENGTNYSDNLSSQNSDFGEFIDPATIEQSNNEYIEEPQQSEEPQQKASQENKRPRQDFAEEKPKQSEPKQRSSVEVLYGYLKIFPNELGEFNSEPKTIIAQINKQALHDYNTWRIPTNEELSLLRANGYVGDGQYMTSETRHGIVLLVTDGNEYKPVKDVPTQTEPQKPRASEPKIIKESEYFVQEQKPKKSSTWVDLGLPSGTKWKRDNESDDYFTYDQAIADYDGNIPTIDQFAELRDKCKWTWENNGYRIEGPNGNTIFLPANGWKRCNGNIGNVGTNGYYMSSTIDRVDYSCYMSFSRETIEFYCGNKCIGRSVRLVTQ